MRTNKPIRSRIRDFKLGGWKGLLWVGIIVVFAFALGAVLLGGGEGSAVDGQSAHDHGADVSNAPALWTCSMHPNIKMPKPGKCPICFMDLIPLETGFGDELGPRQLRMSDTAVQLAQIQTTPAKRASAEAEIRMVGRVAYDETNLASIAAWVPGRLDRLYADFTGVTVKKGDPLVEIYSPELLAAQEELIQARSTLTTLDKSASTLLQSTAEATVTSAQEKLRLFGLAAKQIEAIGTTGKTSDHITVYAPISGVVIHKDAREGMYVTTGTRIYTIADLTRLWVVFEAYEPDLQWIRTGQTIEFTSLSFPGEPFTAVIDFIDPFVDPKTRTVKVRGVAANTRLKLKPDMFVRGVVKSRIGGESIAADTTPVLIPATAPLITGTRAVVYVEIPNEEGPLFEGREVELGARAGDFYVVKSGIMDGEPVVTNGAFKIDSELQIQAKPSMMSPEGGATAGGHSHGPAAARAVVEPKIAAAHTPTEPAAAATRLEEDKKVLAALKPAYDTYFDVHMALANDNHTAAKDAAKKLSSIIGKVDMSIFSAEGHTRWMALSKPAMSNAGELAVSKDIESARTSFYHLSVEMIRLHQSFGHANDGTFYLAHCPMAMDGDGADWLQSEDIVWNPFYGEKMLRCGTIKQIDTPSGNKNG
jgi:Cu(I)/Ag(I) efflux system membrane fusion protein